MPQVKTVNGVPVVRLVAEIPQELYVRLKIRAINDNRTVTNLVAELLDLALTPQQQEG